MAIPYSSTIFGHLQWYSVLIVVGILVAILLASKEEKRMGLPKDTAIDVALIAVPCGIVGARLYYVAMTWGYFSQNLPSILYVWEGGIAIYGGVIGGAIGALVYARRKKLSFATLADIVAPGLLLAQAIGRWGNYFNMEAYGPEILNQTFWFFPAGVLIENSGAWTWHMATFFYESLWNVCGFLAIWLTRKRHKAKGDTFCWYLLIYGSGRFIIEQLRQDSLYLGGLRVSQYVSLLLCAASAGVLLWRAAKGRRGWYAAACICALALLARWATLQNAWLYGGLLIVAWALLIGLCIRDQKRAALWLVCLCAAVDVAGLACSLMGWPFSLSFSQRLHTLICSATLPAYVAALYMARGSSTNQ